MADLTPLYSAPEIQTQIDRLAREIADLHPGGPLEFVIVLKGGFFFGADLSRALVKLGVDVRLHFVSVQSYQGQTQGAVKLQLDLQLQGKQVWVIEDVLDSGATLRRLLPALRNLQPISLKLAVLVQKHAYADLVPDAIGFHSPDHWLVGFGFDQDQALRCLSYIGFIPQTT